MHLNISSFTFNADLLAIFYANVLKAMQLSASGIFIARSPCKKYRRTFILVQHDDAFIEINVISIWSMKILISSLTIVRFSSRFEYVLSVGTHCVKISAEIDSWISIVCECMRNDIHVIWDFGYDQVSSSFFLLSQKILGLLLTIICWCVTLPYAFVRLKKIHCVL